MVKNVFQSHSVCSIFMYCFIDWLKFLIDDIPTTKNTTNLQVYLMFQSMDELDLDDFQYGGVNMTGFTLVSMDEEKVQTVQREWSRLNPNYWRGAGTDRKIKVGHYPYHYLLLSFRYVYIYLFYFFLCGHKSVVEVTDDPVLGVRFKMDSVIRVFFPKFISAYRTAVCQCNLAVHATISAANHRWTIGFLVANVI